MFPTLSPHGMDSFFRSLHSLKRCARLCPAFVRVHSLPLLFGERGNHCVAAEKLVKSAGYGLRGGPEVCLYPWLRVGLREVGALFGSRMWFLHCFVAFSTILLLRSCTDPLHRFPAFLCRFLHKGVSDPIAWNSSMSGHPPNRQGVALSIDIRCQFYDLDCHILACLTECSL